MSQSRSLKTSTNSNIGVVTAELSPAKFRLEDTVNLSVLYEPLNADDYHPIAYEIQSPGFNVNQKYILPDDQGGNLAKKTVTLKPTEPHEKISVLVYSGRLLGKIDFKLEKEANGNYIARQP